ncbi:MAG: type II toxin-antitoxin system RelE family toxin [Dehalococcoidia bacterium]
MSRRVAWSRPAAHDLRRLDPTVADRVRRAILHYAETERGDVRHLVNSVPPTWRLRVGDYRVRFTVEPASADDNDRREWLMIEHVLHRREAYR